MERETVPVRTAVPEPGGTAATPDGGPRTTTAAADAGTAGPLVELLHSVESTVAVSSVVDNNTNGPSLLVDGRLETAWNGRTGAIQGTWVGFRVPGDAAVQEIRLTVGYTHADARVDLFTANYRIRRVQVVRGTTVLGSYVLDTGSRALQTIPVNTPGGEFRVEVLEAQPGTRRAWREVCISELQVFGRAGAASRPAAAPRLAIGTFEDTRAAAIFAARAEVRSQRAARERADRAAASRDGADCVDCNESVHDEYETEARATMELASLVCAGRRPFDAALRGYTRRARQLEALHDRTNGRPIALDSSLQDALRAMLDGARQALAACAVHDRDLDPDRLPPLM